jgi:predicted glycosyltransferase
MNMKILFYFGHPSQYLFLSHGIRLLRESGHTCEIIIKSKDILEKLLIENGENYINILPEGRRPGKIGIMLGLIRRDYRLLRLVRNRHYDLFVGTDPSLAHVGYLKRIPILTVLEDDINVIPQLARITYPFTTYIVTPSECKTGRFEKKTIHYEGYMKLAYLHPNRFKKTEAVLKKPYYLIRRSKLDAYHDKNIAGLSFPLIAKIIDLLKESGSVYISSEGTIENSLKSYELQVKPSEIQQVLANASLLISDSQSMSAEAAMLGVPSIRFSDFAGKISVLEALEHKYGLTYGIPTDSPDKLFNKIKEFLSYRDLANEFVKRRQCMLADKIDVTAFMVWFIENYPASAGIMRENPGYQERFRGE